VAQHGENSPQLLPVLAQMVRQGLDPDEWQKTVTRIWSLMSAAGAPADVRVIAEFAKRNSDTMKVLPNKATPLQHLTARRERLVELLGELKRRGEDGGRAGAYVRAELGATYGTTGFAEAQQLYREVLAMPASQLPEDDPIRKAVKAQLAVLADVRSRAGSQAVPCALADPVPLPVNERIGSEAFPDEALRWGFAGWAKVAFDITARGEPANVRTVMAYPPFIFGPATEKAIARFRYQPLPASAGTIGCSNTTRRVRYVLPSGG
jgi:hypothetical protein